MNAYRSDYNYQEPDEIMIPSKDGFIIIPTHSIRVHESSNQKTMHKNSNWTVNKLWNILQFTLMPTGILALLAYIGFSIAGGVGLFVLSTAAGVSIIAYTGKQLERKLRAQSIDTDRS